MWLLTERNSKDTRTTWVGWASDWFIWALFHGLLIISLCSCNVSNTEACYDELEAKKKYDSDVELATGAENRNKNRAICSSLSVIIIESLRIYVLYENKNKTRGRRWQNEKVNNSSISLFWIPLCRLRIFRLTIYKNRALQILYRFYREKLLKFLESNSQ